MRYLASRAMPCNLKEMAYREKLDDLAFLTCEMKLAIPSIKDRSVKDIQVSNAIQERI